MTTPPSPPIAPQSPTTTLFVIPARDAAVAAILRRRPTKVVQLIRWNTARDTFEQGRWFKGRVYERRCDLSPHGRRLVPGAPVRARDADQGLRRARRPPRTS